MLLESHGAQPSGGGVRIGGGSRGSEKGKECQFGWKSQRGGQSQTAVQGEEPKEGKENRSFVLAGALRARFVRVVFIKRQNFSEGPAIKIDAMLWRRGRDTDSDRDDAMRCAIARSNVLKVNLASRLPPPAFQETPPAFCPEYPCRCVVNARRVSAGLSP